VERGRAYRHQLPQPASKRRKRQKCAAIDMI
jgi:hypothetical protein